MFSTPALYDEDADCHCASNGRPRMDLENAVRLVLAGFLIGTVNDRRLMHEARVTSRAAPIRI